MDHVKLLNQVRSKETIKLAFIYALNDRRRNDAYFDHFEIQYATKHQDKIIEEIFQELKKSDLFRPRVAYVYYFPKSNLCYRRMIYIPFKDLVVRYAFVIILAKHLDASLSEKCFANRRTPLSSQIFSVCTSSAIDRVLSQGKCDAMTLN